MDNNILAFKFEYLLLEYYKELNLTEKEISVIFMSKHLLKQKNSLITADLLSLKMTIPTKEIDEILVSLFNKKYINLKKTSKGMMTSLEPLEKILIEMAQISIYQDVALEKNNDLKKDYNELINLFEEKLNKTLSPIEKGTIKIWLLKEKDKNLIIDCLYEGIKKKKTSLSEIKEILLTYSMRKDIDKQGFTTIDKNWSKNVDETLDIANKEIKNK